jgi:hypothetical protein
MTPPSSGQTASMVVDMIVVFHVTDNSDPAPLSPPMFRWRANVTQHGPPATQAISSLLVYILAIAGGVVVLLVIIVFVVRAAKPGKRSGSFNVRTTTTPL